MIEPLMTVAEVSRQTRLSKPYIYGLIDRGDLPALRFGTAVRVDPADVKKFISERRTTNGSSIAEMGRRASAF